MSAKAKRPIPIGVLAREVGVSPDTIRHYERKGVLAAPARAMNGYRDYPVSAIDRVRLVRRALSVGFTLKELARILEERDRGGTPCRSVRVLAGQKLADVENRLKELNVLRDDLHELLTDWDRRLNRTPAGKRAGLLESLAAEAPATRPRRPLRPKKRGKENP